MFLEEWNVWLLRFLLRVEHSGIGDNPRFTRVLMKVFSAAFPLADFNSIRLSDTSFCPFLNQIRQDDRCISDLSLGLKYIVRNLLRLNRHSFSPLISTG